MQLDLFDFLGLLIHVVKHFSLFISSSIFFLRLFFGIFGFIGQNESEGAVRNQGEREGGMT